MKIERSSGLLLHISSLPGKYGIGTLGSEAFRFVDQLREAGQRYWQILPIGPVSAIFGYSPYASSSTFAGNLLFISIEAIIQEEWFTADLPVKLPSELDDYHVDYPRVLAHKIATLQRIFEYSRTHANPFLQDQISRFFEIHDWWLADYALFAALGDYHHSYNWQSWPANIVNREAGALNNWREKLEEAIYFHKFVQFLFFRQWHRLKQYAREKGIQIIGDLPIYVTMDSADVWANREIFQLDRDTGLPNSVAGVPPDYFSKTGQRWGNPLYQWFEEDTLKKETLNWWLSRLKFLLSIVDVVRIDHFRGFESFWAIPAKEKTAVKGEWLPGPGAHFFEYMKRELEDLPLIAEDLGMITPAVETVRNEFDFPGMKVLQFAFDGNSDNPHLPHNFKTSNCVVYTGTHDNNTSLGWIIGSESKPEQKRRVLDYLGLESRDEFHWHFIRLALASGADLTIIPVQDILGLGEESRMNIPGKETHNWSWKLKSKQLSVDSLRRLREMCRSFHR